MDREALLKQLVELMGKDELADKFKAVSNMEEMRALLRKNGMNADDETLDALVATVVYFNTSNTDELDEEELEAVSGGGAWSFLCGVAKVTWEVGTYASSKIIGKSHKETKNMIKKFWGWNC